MPDPRPPEYNVIVDCLTGIRRRLWTVRLVERLTLALVCGAFVGLPLTASRLLREPLPWENIPWTALLLALVPLAGAAWILRFPHRFQSFNLTPAFIRIAGILTATLSLTMIALLFLPIGKQIPIWSIPVATIAAFAIVASATVRMIDFRRAAIYVDHHVGLHERVSTALEMLETTVTSSLETSFRQPVIASAVAACQQVRNAKVEYRRLDSRTYALASLVTIAAACLTLIPPMPARAVSVRKPSTILVRQSKDLHDVLAELEQNKLPNDTVTPEKLKPLQNAINQLQNGAMNQIQSDAVLNEAKEQLKKEQDAMAAADKVQDILKQMGQTQDLAKAADSEKDAQMQKAQGDAGAGDQQKSADQALKSAADAMAEKMKSGQMSEAQKKDLADKLQAAADKAAADPQLQKDLQSAADAARNGNADQLSQSMQSAGQRLGQQSAGSQMSQGAINRALSEIDQMQNRGGQGTQSTMAGNQGNQGNQGQGGNQGQNGNQSGNGSQNGNGNTQANGGGAPAPDRGNGTPQGNNPSPGQNPGGNGTTSDNGSTMLEARGGPGGNHEGPIGGKQSFVRIYDARATDTNGSQEKVGSSINPLNGPANGTMDIMGPADDKNSQIKTYSDVLPEARQQAMDELTRQEYPPQYQEMVRQFYGEAPRK